MSKGFLKLVIMVKDGADVIAKTLTSYKPYIDSWLVLDTGSTDGTQSIIRETTKKWNRRGIVGELVEEPFINFRDSRNRALDLSESRPKECEWTIMVDDSYILRGGDNLVKCLRNAKDIDAISIMIKDKTQFYPSVRIIRTLSKARFDQRYRRHEVIALNQTEVTYIGVQDCYLEDVSTPKGVERSRQRFEADYNELVEDLGIYPNDQRIMFYLGRTCGTLAPLNKDNYYNLMQESVEWYRKSMLVTKDEDIDKRYECLIAIAHTFYLLHERKEIEWGVCHDAYLDAYEYVPRAEPLYYISKHYMDLSKLRVAYMYALTAFRLPQVLSSQFNNYTITDTELPKMVAYLASNMEDYDMCEKALKKLETNPNKSINDLKFVSVCRELIRNRQNPAVDVEIPPENVNISDRFRIVICSGINSLYDCWSPTFLSTGPVIRGSEVMAVKLSEILCSTYNYEVVLFGNFVSGNRDYQTTYNGVACIDNSKYDEYIGTHKIDVLIVSRYTHFIRYTSTIDRVYLWLHDTEILGNSFIYKPKLKGVWCLTDFHKNLITSSYNIKGTELESKMYTIYNAIDPKRFEHHVSKVPHTYIYTSSVERGLLECIEVFKIIREVYPQATLNVYCDLDTPYARQNPDLIRKIRECVTNSIRIHKPIPQDELAKEFLKAQVWLYPTNFPEVYCITALEAQISGCLCVTTKLAALTEVVGDRGILIEGVAGTKVYNDKLLSRLQYVLIDKDTYDDMIRRGKEYAYSKSFSNLGNCINNMIRE